MSEQIEKLKAAVKRLNQQVTDQQYMIEHLVQMLGPKGREVWKMWQAQNLQRIHVSWDPSVDKLTGEEIADLHLKIEKAITEARPA